MARIIKPPSPLQDGFSVFLAGSIELGRAEIWQTVLDFRRAAEGLTDQDLADQGHSSRRQCESARNTT